jgi:hypothetical protein
MNLTTAQLDGAVGVLLGTAAGDRGLPDGLNLVPNLGIGCVPSACTAESSAMQPPTVYRTRRL